MHTQIQPLQLTTIMQLESDMKCQHQTIELLAEPKHVQRLAHATETALEQFKERLAVYSTVA